VQAVARAGVNIRSVYDFVNYLPTPRFVVPALLECLDQIAEPMIKGGVLRALADKVARGLTEERLLKELDRTFAATPQQTDHGVHIPCAWELAMALGAVTTRRSAEAVLQVLRNRVYGRERAPYVDVFLKTQDPRVTGVLLELLEDDDTYVLLWVVSAIRRRKIMQALPKLRQLQSHPHKHLRKKITQAIAKLERLGSASGAT
jgi:HEAT repeat protein